MQNEKAEEKLPDYQIRPTVALVTVILLLRFLFSSSLREEERKRGEKC